VPRMNMEKLDELYALIDGCKCCELGCLPMNSGRRLRLKRGTRPILVVGQNPGRRVVPECDHVWGGLDLLLLGASAPQPYSMWHASSTECGLRTSSSAKPQRIIPSVPNKSRIAGSGSTLN
jgi:hypothetical protein